MVLALDSLDGLVQVRVEGLAGGIERLQTHTFQGIREPLINELDALGEVLVRGFHFEGAFEIVQHREQVFYEVRSRELKEIGALLLETLAGVVEIGEATPQAILQLGLLGKELIALRRYRRKLPLQRDGWEFLFLIGDLIGLFGIHYL